MRLNLRYILDQIHDIWRKQRQGSSFSRTRIFNLFCRTLISNWQDRETYEVCKLLNGNTKNIYPDVQTASVSRRAHERMVQEIEKEIVPNLQPDKILDVMNNWKTIINNDESITLDEKEKLNTKAGESFSQFLAEIILYVFVYNCCSEISANRRSNVRHSEGTDTTSLLHKNSRKELLRLQKLLKYKVISNLVPNIDSDISEQDRVLLVADGGSGKSSWLFNLWSNLLESNAAGTKELPVYVPLNRFEGNDENFIRNYIRKHYFSSQDGFDFDDWIKSAKDCNVVLLLDAINEAKNSRELGSEIEILCFLGCKIILTSRYEMEGWVSLEIFKRVHLLPLSETIVDEQLKEHKLEVSERLRPFLTKPMYLALLLKIGEGVKEVESPGELLLAHHKWVQQTFGVDKHGLVYHEIGEIAFDTVLPQIASVMDTLKFNGKDVKSVIEEHFADEGWDYREVLNLFVDAGILTKEHQTYFFSHEHYLDFYRAYGIYSVMTDGGIPKVLGADLISNAVAVFLGDLLGEYKFELKSDCNSDMSPVETFMQQHLRHTRHQENRIAIRNLVETMKIARNDHITANYSDLDTSLCNFYGCSLTNSLFIGSVVSQNSFISNGHKDYIDLLAYSPKNKQLLSSTRHGKTVLVWNTSTGELIDEILCTENVLDIDVSLDEQRFLILTKYFIKVIIFEDPSESYSQKCLDSEGNQQQITFAKFIDDSTRIICVTSDGYIRILDVFSGLEYTAEKIDDWSNEVFELYALSQNRKILASVRQAGGISIRRIENLSNSIPISPLTQQDTYRVFGVAVCREEYVVVAGWKKFLAFSIKEPEMPPITSENPYLLWGSFVDTTTGIVCSVVEDCDFVSWDISQNKLTCIKDGFSDKDVMKCAVGLTTSPDRSVIIAADTKQEIHFYDTVKNQNTRQFWVGFPPQRASTSSENELTLGTESYLMRETWAGKFESLDMGTQQVHRIELGKNYSIAKGVCLFVKDQNSLSYRVLDLCTGKQILCIPMDCFSCSTIVLKTKDSLILDNQYNVQIWPLSNNTPPLIVEGMGRWIEKNPEGKTAFSYRHESSFWKLIKKFAVPYDDDISDADNTLGQEIAQTPTVCIPDRDVHDILANLGIVVGGMLDGTIKTWSLADGSCKISLKISNSAIIRVSAMEGTPYVVLQSEDAHIHVIDLSENERLLEWADDNCVLNNAVFVGFSPVLCSKENVLLPNANNESILTLSTPKGSLFVYIPKSKFAVYSISGDRTKIAICNESLLPGSCILVYDLIAGTESVVACNKISFGSCGLSESGNALYVSSIAGDVFVVNLESKEIEYAWRTTNARDIWMCDFSMAAIKGNSHFIDILKLNGAITDMPLGDTTYDVTELFEFY